MEQYQNSMAAQFSGLLDEREAQLRALMREASSVVHGAPLQEPREVTDFKDVAEDEAQAMVDEAQVAHAVHELDQIQAARQRLSEHRYGICEDCGQPINLRRLLALPATPVCTACQTARENQSGRIHSH